MLETTKNSNLVEVLEGMLKGAGLILHNRAVIDGRMKANFVVENPENGGKQHVIEIIEDDIAHYKQQEHDP